MTHKQRPWLGSPRLLRQPGTLTAHDPAPRGRGPQLRGLGRAAGVPFIVLPSFLCSSLQPRQFSRRLEWTRKRLTGAACVRLSQHTWDSEDKRKRDVLQDVCEEKQPRRVTPAEGPRGRAECESRTGMLRFIVLWEYGIFFFFYKPKVCGNPGSEQVYRGQCSW